MNVLVQTAAGFAPSAWGTSAPITNGYLGALEDDDGDLVLAFEGRDGRTHPL